MKRIVAILLILCLCPLCAWTETAEAPDKQSFSELMCAIVAANQPEILWGRYESLTFQFSNPAAPDGYDVVWQTKDAYYQSYADLFAVWEKDQVYCRMDWELLSFLLAPAHGRRPLESRARNPSGMR